LKRAARRSPISTSISKRRNIFCASGKSSGCIRSAEDWISAAIVLGNLFAASPVEFWLILQCAENQIDK